MPAGFIANQASKGHFAVLADSPYALGCIPNVLVDARLLPFHVFTGPYRGPGYNSYPFMVATHGRNVKRFDAEQSKAMPGVLGVVTVDPDEPRGLPGKSGAPSGYDDTHVRAAIAVIAEHYWQAGKALDVIQIEWDDGAGAQWNTTEQMVDAWLATLERPAGKG